MSLPVWGQLEKAADDPTTIEEEIESLIEAHNDETDAHLGTSQSLNQHKDENVIDHPAGSVVSDKTTDREVVFSPQFESLDSWDAFDNYDTNSAGQLGLYIEDGFADVSRLSTTFVLPTLFLSLSFDSLFEVVAQPQTANTNYDFMFGIFGAATFSADGIGFHYQSGTLTGVFKGSSGDLSTAAISVDVSDAHFYRVRYDAADQVVYFVIDGQDVGSLDLSSESFNTSTGPCFRMENTGSNDGSLYINTVRTTRSLV